MANVTGIEANRAILLTLRGHMREWMNRVGDTHQPPRGT